MIYVFHYFLFIFTILFIWQVHKPGPGASPVLYILVFTLIPVFCFVLFCLFNLI